MDRDHVLHLLRQIEHGEVLLNALGVDPQEEYCGNISYRTSTRLNLIIFNDCNEWDYVDSVWKGNIRLFDYDQPGFLVEFDHYRPSEEISWQRYGMPGYMKCRCILCGRVFQRLAAIAKYGFVCPPGTAHETPLLPRLCQVELRATYSS